MPETFYSRRIQIVYGTFEFVLRHKAMYSKESVWIIRARVISISLRLIRLCEHADDKAQLYSIKTGTYADTVLHSSRH